MGKSQDAQGQGTPDREDATQTELHDWRGTVDDFMRDSKLHRQATAMQMESLRQELEDNTVMTRQIKDDLGGALPMLVDLGGFARTLTRVSKFLVKVGKPLFYFAAFLAACVMYFKTGRWEMPGVP